jgi:hypothetical protein
MQSLPLNSAAGAMPQLQILKVNPTNINDDRLNVPIHRHCSVKTADIHRNDSVNTLYWLLSAVNETATPTEHLGE